MKLINTNNLRVRLRSLLAVLALLCALVLNAAEPASKVMHFSFDDGYFFLNDLKKKEKTYTSIFDTPFLGKLKSLHEQYGAVFSIYCFTYSPGLGWNIGPVSTAFAEEFVANADWLKLGFHCKNSSGNTGPEYWQLEDYNNFLSVIPDVEGREKCFDLVPRLHNFGVNATVEFCNTLKNHEDIGVRGFLTTDDSRNSYYLTTEQSKYINSNDSLYDAENGLYFFKSETRLESVKDGDVDAFLATFLTPAYENRANVMPIFTHEYAVANQNGTLRTDKDIFERMETCMKWAIANNYRFDYPMNIMAQSSQPSTKIETMQASEDFITVKGKTISSGGRVGTFKIYNAAGAVLLVEEGTADITVDLSAGFYLLQFESNDGSKISKKIILS